MRWLAAAARCRAAGGGIVRRLAGLAGACGGLQRLAAACGGLRWLLELKYVVSEETMIERR